MKLIPKWAKGLFFLQESGLLIRQKHQFAYKGPHCENCFSLPVVMYGCESWTTQKAECWKIDVFKLWCWKRLLRVPWTARRSNQSVLKEVSLEYSLKELVLKLKLQYFGHLMWRANSLEKTLMLGKNEGRRRREQQRMRWLMASLIQGTWVWANSRRWWKAGRPGVLQSMGSQRVEHKWATEQQQPGHKLLAVKAAALQLQPARLTVFPSSDP